MCNIPCRVLLKENNHNKIKMVDENNKFIDKFVTFNLLFTGIWKSSSNHKQNLSVVILNFTVLALGFVSIVYMFTIKYDDIDVNTEILLHSVQIAHAMWALIIVVTKKTYINETIEGFNIDIRNFQLPSYNIEQCRMILEKEKKSFHLFMRISSLCIFTVYSSVIFDSNALNLYGKQKILYPSWFPFDTESNLVCYYVAVVFQLAVYWELLIVDLSMAALWFGTIAVCSGLLDILCLHVQALVEDPQARSDQLHAKIKDFVNLHNYVRKLSRNLTASLGLVFFGSVTSCGIATGFCIFHVIQATYTWETGRLLKFMFGIGVFTFFLFIYCITGQRLKNKSEDFFKSLYNSNWYEQPVGLQKTLYICQTVSKKPLEIECAHTIHANLNIFVKTMRYMFSFLNFLLAISGKVRNH